ncbi:MAG: hypothetical protein MUF72_17550 [Elainella sp. Prado103]|jgi:hypothetical protein|nr:hypothetical protein [Elainella sp. Prado103]
MSKNRWLWVGLSIVVIALLSLVSAPQSGQLQRGGSTYSRAPSGYGAWYAYMQQQTSRIQRWERPLFDLIEQQSDAESPTVEEIRAPFQPSSQPANLSTDLRSNPSDPAISLSSLVQSPPLPQPPLSPQDNITVVRINSGWDGLDVSNPAWIRQGNVLVLVGVRAPVTAAPFRSALPSPVGAVQIETRRRQAISPVNPSAVQLFDQFGAVVWEKRMGAGRVIFVATPYLAANAYQDQPGNLAFLAQLVLEPGYPIYVDEYLHGYRDQETQQAENRATLGDYLAKTPFLLLGIQIGVLLFVALWGQNQRLGPAKIQSDPPIQHSTAYIEALSSVLHQAHSPQFVVATIGQAEQRQIQRALGLGTALVEPTVLMAAWSQQTGQPPEVLQTFLEPLLHPRPMSDRALQAWLDQLQLIRNQLDRRL